MTQDFNVVIVGVARDGSRCAIDVDISTVPAVAALVERVKALEDFRARVASLMTAADCVVLNDNLDREATYEEISEHKADMGINWLMEEFEAFESIILQARDLASPDAANEGGAA